ncbi:MAG: hypothetical protein A3J48_03950 [Candidatus Doudnabacteria bacterium RIFCSPHIGHO2_02_FULL_46_11]|uniref:UDP-glucose 4-epimerase n=1 Tax=Candidatus Doudnabacteria bacterium RIFCSPHIGHO2_02_FULL_46_11 TaxID=1817832 RepID=A0A1F5P826_9BACT|nr:MAG: hypothetical protein A3J48_03950 [Candidatus Doudnabacteria bacterium RIFCSPHIGHO2_02_FULL_46_11]
MLSKQALKEILELIGESDGTFVILEKDSPRIAVLDFKVYENLVNKAKYLKSLETHRQELPLKKDKVLFTGGAGRFGSAVVRALLTENYEVVIIDDLSKGDRARIPENVEFYEGDYRNQELLSQIFENHKFDAVVHFAEKSGHLESAALPDEYMLSNVEGGLQFLKFLVKNEVSKVIYRSSFDCGSVYARSKILFEQVLNFYHHSFGLNSIALRFPRIGCEIELAGVDPSVLVFEDPLQAVLNTAAGKANFMSVANVKEGSAEVELISQEDAVSAVILAADHLKTSSGSMVYSVPGTRTSLDNLIEAAMTVTNKMVPTMRAADDGLWEIASDEKIQSLEVLGFQNRLQDLESLIKSYWLKTAPPERLAGPAVVETYDERQLKEPVSLSELLSGRFTPFIKPHNS